jgi:hypothetical protein
VAISLRVDKSFTYRGAPEQWSNRYHLSGGNPASEAEWLAILNAIAQVERAFLAIGVKIVGGSGYLTDDGAAAFTYEYATGSEWEGLYQITSGEMEAPGDVAVWARWWCGKYSKRGKKIYLRKYFHGIALQGADIFAPPQRALMLTYAQSMQAGFAVPSFSQRAICDKDGAGALEHEVVTWSSMRELKRRSNSPL